MFIEDMYIPWIWVGRVNWIYVYPLNMGRACLLEICISPKYLLRLPRNKNFVDKNVSVYSIIKDKHNQWTILLLRERDRKFYICHFTVPKQLKVNSKKWNIVIAHYFKTYAKQGWGLEIGEGKPPQKPFFYIIIISNHLNWICW